jgi:monofunctional biosynthetic peptidoglycan transglycosylase|tara:strand:+ start:45789 stop:46511 length:723 start_codon:yes stop_codon:yes gene_type:complete
VARKTRARKRRVRKGGFRPFRFLGKLLLAVLLLTLAWVLVYRFVPVPATSIMIRDWTNGTGVTRDWVGFDQISPNLPRAVIGAEDAKFCAHWGFDFEAIEKAMETNEAGGQMRGASTISQQTAKNAFLWPGRNMVRKGLEAYFTGLIEVVWGKRRIMEVYLNVAEFGVGVYGAEAASRHYFSKSAKDLTRTEAARLAAILPDPITRSASSPGPYTTRYAGNIERWIPIVDRDGQDSCLGI